MTVSAPHRTRNASTALVKAKEDDIDMETFEQILELDEDDTHDFSCEMVWQYFSQAQVTFQQMDDALCAYLSFTQPLSCFTSSLPLCFCSVKSDLDKLSSLGHFLKGSSAALGVTKVQATCEKIQHYGKLWDDENKKDLSETVALGMIGPLLKSGKAEYTNAEEWLKSWYKEHGITGPPPAEK